jgi:hypothetical protein
MGWFTSPTSFRLASGSDASIVSTSLTSIAFGAMNRRMTVPHESHPPLVHLMLLVFEAVMEVVCVSLPGYIVARQGMFDADKQKFCSVIHALPKYTFFDDHSYRLY